MKYRNGELASESGQEQVEHLRKAKTQRQTTKQTDKQIDKQNELLRIMHYNWLLYNAWCKKRRHKKKKE